MVIFYSINNLLIIAVLQTIHQCGPCRQGMISEVTCISAGTVPQMVCVTADQKGRLLLCFSLSVNVGLSFPKKSGIKLLKQVSVPLRGLHILGDCEK